MPSRAAFILLTFIALLLIHYLTGYLLVDQVVDTFGANREALPITHKDYFIFSLKWSLMGAPLLPLLLISFSLPELFNRAQGIQERIRENLQEAERDFALLQKKKDGKIGWLLSLKLHFYRKPLEIFWTSVLLVYFLFLVLISGFFLQQSLKIKGDDITVSVKPDQKIEALRVFAFSEFYLVQGKDGIVTAVMNQAFESLHRDPHLSF